MVRLYLFPLSGIRARHRGLENYVALNCDMHSIDRGHGDQLTPEYVALNPNKKMPMLEDNGLVLWESNAILFYMSAKHPNSGLWPSDPECQADVLAGSRVKAPLAGKYYSRPSRHCQPSACAT